MAHPVVLYHPLFWWVRWLLHAHAHAEDAPFRQSRMRGTMKPIHFKDFQRYITATSVCKSMQALYTGFTVLTQIDKSNSKQPSTKSL